MADEVLIQIVIVILGLCFGSFASVIVRRLPNKEKIFSLDRSRCPHCKNVISWWQNIPLLSFVLLKGKCAHCHAQISWRYPLLEVLMATLFWLAYMKLGLSWTLLEILIFIFGLVTVSFIDFDHYILPDVFTLSGIVTGLVGAFLNPDRSVSSALAGVFIGGGSLWLIAYLYWVLRKQEGLGGGDIKLIAWIGAVLGWPAVPFVIFSGSLIGSAAGLLVAFRKKEGLQSVIPFGPFLALGALLYLFVGRELGLWYVNFFLPDLFPQP